MTQAPLLAVERLRKTYALARRGLLSPAPTLTAVDDVSFTLAKGASLGIVGESGSGKSTVAKLVMALERPDAGKVLFDGRDIGALPEAKLRPLRRRFQMVFQDPYGSLDPRLVVARSVAEPLEVAEPGLSRAETRERVAAMLEAVGLGSAALDRYPHEFSGGQRQRVALARALITAPDLIVADEPVSALDVSIQAQVLNLMLDLKARLGVAYLFISHNLAVVEHVCDDVVVMLKGRVVERGPAVALFERPEHPYTRALVDAVPDPTAEPAPRARLKDAADVEEGVGCVFAARCPRASARCKVEAPPLLENRDRALACWHPLG
jgi:peptide/nickel transport system ATP-binding protein